MKTTEGRKGGKEKETKNWCKKQKTVSHEVYINPAVSIIILNMSVLYTPVKIQ